MKISAMAAAAAAAAANELEINEAGVTKKLTVAQLADFLHPIGSLYFSTNSTNPATLFGFGTWAAFGAGRVMVGYDAGDADFDTVEETGGAKTSNALLAHTHPITDPGHNHTQNAHNHGITDPTHNHTQNGHTHTIPVGATDDTAAPFDRADAGTNTGGANATTATGSTTPTNNAAATGVTVNNATAANQSASTGITGTGSAGSGTSFPIMPPFIVIYAFKRTA